MEEMEREKEPREGPSAAEFLLLDQKVGVWASQKIRNSTGAELAADKAMAYLLDRCLRGDPPREPFAWLKTAIDTVATKLKQGRKGMRSLEEEAFREVFSTVDSLPYQLNPPEEREWLEPVRQYLESIREELEKLLKEHQLLALKWIFLGTLILAPIDRRDKSLVQFVIRGCFGSGPPTSRDRISDPASFRRGLHNISTWGEVTIF